MDAKKKLAIVGLGWLGAQLKDALKDSYDIVGTKRSCPGASSCISFDVTKDNTPEALKSADFVIISIPPFRSSQNEFYGTCLGRLAEQLSPKAQVIYTSSTGVYPKLPGVYNEDFIFGAEDRNELFYAEQMLSSVLGNRLTILRLGGLIGPNRHPIHFLKGRVGLTGGNDGISLIDGRDICVVINQLISKEDFGAIYNLAYPSELSKRSYYERVSRQLDLAPPEYLTEPDVKPRIIGTDRIRKKYGQFLIHDILKMSQPLDN